MPVRGRFVTLLKVKNHLLKDEKSAGLEVTRFWPKLLGLESCSEEADCFQPERVIENLVFCGREKVLTKRFYSNLGPVSPPALEVASSSHASVSLSNPCADDFILGMFSQPGRG